MSGNEFRLPRASLIICVVRLKAIVYYIITCLPVAVVRRYSLRDVKEREISGQTGRFKKRQKSNLRGMLVFSYRLNSVDQNRSERSSFTTFLAFESVERLLGSCRDAFCGRFYPFTSRIL